MDKDYENFVQRMGSFEMDMELDDELDHSLDDIVDELLEHHGVKGMKLTKQTAAAKKAEKKMREADKKTHAEARKYLKLVDEASRLPIEIQMERKKAAAKIFARETIKIAGHLTLAVMTAGYTSAVVPYNLSTRQTRKDEVNYKQRSKK